MRLSRLGVEEAMMLSIENLKNYLGKPSSQILADPRFREWRFERSVDNDVNPPCIDYVFQEDGLDFSCDQDEGVATIFLHNNEHRRFEAGLSDLPFSLTRKEVIERLGSPSAISDPGDPYLAWDRFGRPEYSIHVTYYEDRESIALITLMRADVVPSTSSDDIVLVFVPSLVAILLRAEQDKGTPLTEAEVLKIRDESVCIAMPRDVVPGFIEKRGYEDIDAERCWEQWQEVRVTLVTKQ